MVPAVLHPHQQAVLPRCRRRPTRTISRRPVPPVGTYHDASTPARRHFQKRSTIAAQDLRLICRARDRDDAEQRPYRWLVHCPDAAIPELARLARTMDALREALLAHFDTDGFSNGPREAMNC
ncbi:MULTISPECIES: transposase [unclassified Frankia]|uniref:transposase n=1 Tax=unclassified Frankia TaxID=2632575 RepID=UPI002AD3957C|nr:MULTISPECIES: transposase [unclassified Frankia]